MILLSLFQFPSRDITLSRSQLNCSFYSLIHALFAQKELLISFRIALRLPFRPAKMTPPFLIENCSCEYFSSTSPQSSLTDLFPQILIVNFKANLHCNSPFESLRILDLFLFNTIQLSSFYFSIFSRIWQSIQTSFPIQQSSVYSDWATKPISLTTSHKCSYLIVPELIFLCVTQEDDLWTLAILIAFNVLMWPCF